MKKNKLDRYETKQTPPISENQHRANIDLAVSLLAPVVEKSAANSAPVNESFDELLDQMRNGVKRQPVIVQTHDGRRVQVSDSGELTEIEKRSEVPKSDTGIKSGGSETSANDTGNFTPEEMKTLAALQESLKNG